MFRQLLISIYFGYKIVKNDFSNMQSKRQYQTKYITQVNLTTINTYKIYQVHRPSLTNKLKIFQKPMDTSSHHPPSKQFTTNSTPYKEVFSQYITPQASQLKPIDINPNYKAFPETFNIHQNSVTYEYKPKVIMSGFIVGEPVGYSELPHLPAEYSRFSPSKQNVQKPVFFQASSTFPKQFNLSTSVFRQQENLTIPESLNRGSSVTKNRSRIITSVPIPQQVISNVRRQDYDRLLNENIMLRSENSRLLNDNKNLNSQTGSIFTKDKRINELQRQISSLRQQLLMIPINHGQVSTVSSNLSQTQTKDQAISQVKMQQVQEILSICLSKYRDSILEQQKLLIDRFRLQCKNQELDLKKQKLLESRKQQTQRKSSMYEKTRIKHHSPSKENWDQPYWHEHNQRHWRK